jgi:16S rRNA processing protein RimM
VAALAFAEHRPLENSMTAAEQWVWLARVRRTQGRKGEVFADILTDFPEKFAERSHLGLFRESDSAHPRVSQLLNHWPHKGGIVLHFAGIDSISAAEELIGMIVAIPKAERAELDEGDVYVSDLIGCTVVDLAGTEPVDLGEIEDVDRALGPVAMLIVRGSEGEILIPFAKDYLRRVDLPAKRVEMALPEGLATLNASHKSRPQ